MSSRPSQTTKKEIENRFYGPLEFGTAGLRGTMYTGLHNMNRHVIRWATQGFANVIRAEGEEAMKKASPSAWTAATTRWSLRAPRPASWRATASPSSSFESLRPTPELSFAVREYGCEAGINVTASHNPKEYNGYKVYWSGRRAAAAPARRGHRQGARAHRHFHRRHVDGLR